MDNEERQEMAGASEQASTEQEVSVSSDASTSGAVSAADQTPAILANEYRYERLIGEGSNGKTWLGININTGEKLAIKSLKLSQSENLKSFELFKREAAVLASVNIDGVPLFYNSIVSDDLGGECYIIQQYVDSESLLVPLENGKVFDEVATLKLIRQVAVILCALHKNYVPPIIHRDIKPSNILCDIQENGEFGKAYLIDFGAVANPQHKNGGSTVAGTYGYMAPEQMIGECTTGSDLYSLGATALHMLTGKPPYEIDADVFKLKYEEAIKEHAPNTSANMVKLIGLLLVPEAAKRVDDAEAVVQMIDRVLEGRDPEESDGTDQAMTEAEREEASRLRARYRRGKSWVTVDGMVYARTFRIHECFEYTFMAKVRVGLFKREVFCNGLFPVKNMDRVYSTLKMSDFPLPCKVSYNPSEPRYNVLLSIDTSKKDNKPQVLLLQ